MSIRRAQEKDSDRIMDLLLQVLMVHHEARPDLFKGPATKYTKEELSEILSDDSRPVFVWTDEEDAVQGYAFCVLKELTGHNILQDVRSLYIDDLCVDERCRGRHIGKELYEYVLAYAKKAGCYNVFLNVWADNEKALGFYRAMGLRTQRVIMEEILL